jgi:vacuolar-type H+-ATPase subunit I/STV1
MNAYVLGVLVVTIVAALSVAGLLLVRRIVGVDKLREFNEVAGNSFQVVGTFYAVLLGLIVVDAMTNMADLRGTLETEANAVADTYILARGLPEPQKSLVRGQCVSYVDAVLNEEWEAMAKRGFSKKAVISSKTLWEILLDYNPTADNEKDIRSRCLDNLAELGDARRARLLSSRHTVSTELWTVLAIGGALTLGFSYFMGLHSAIGQSLMTAVIAVVLSLNVYLVYLFGYPFSGVYRLQPEGFYLDKIIFKFTNVDNAKIPEGSTTELKEMLKD